MLTYISVSIENQPFKCGVSINATAQKTSTGNVNSIKISRKRHGESSWVDIYTVPISSVADLSFNLLDILVLSGSTYDYNFDLMSGRTIVESGRVDNIRCWFEGLFVGDFKQYFVAGTNCRTETQRNTAVEYVTTLSGQYPYRVSNADLNYTTGTSSGLFLELDSIHNHFIPDTYHQFSNKVLDYLADGQEKILKTHDGQAWMITVDANPHKAYSGFYGMNPIEFAWTEIGELPPFGMIKE